MKQRNWMIAVVVLVILNLISLGALWKYKFEDRQAVNRPAPERYMRERLSLGDEQLIKLEELRREHFRRIRPLEQSMNEARRGLFMPDSAGQLSQGDLSAALDQIGRLQVQTDSLTYVHFREVRSICTPDQAREFSEMMRDMTHRRFGEGRGKGRGRE